MHVQKLTMKGNYPLNCVIAMGETAVWLDMVANPTVNATWAKDMSFKSAGNEKVSQCLFDSRSRQNEDETIHSCSWC